MKVQVLMLLATLTAAVAHEYLLDGDDRSPPSEDDDWKRFKVSLTQPQFYVLREFNDWENYTV